MSAALVRQALEFVDPDESSDKRKKRGSVQQPSSTGQVTSLKKNKKLKKTNLKKKKNLKAEEDNINRKVISKLLKLSKPIVDSKITSKIVKRARTGKPVIEKVKVKKESHKSILFPDDDDNKKKSKKSKK